MTRSTPAADAAARSDTPGFVARLLDNPVTLLVARVCITLPFLAGGLAKLIDWQGGVAEMQQTGLEPAWAFNLAVLLVELGGSALIILDRKTWLGAGALGVFTLLATLMAHRFWEFTGPARSMEMNSFLEHATICAAFIFVVVVGLRPRVRGR
ncbi:DoxX family protein [Hypericibacter sp.]|uniref:DoxX family protein n=1 Tax=Hypericibacter sp. TaxID=2705401 RepID=UPI003D6D1A4F